MKTAKLIKVKYEKFGISHSLDFRCFACSISKNITGDALVALIYSLRGIVENGKNTKIEVLNFDSIDYSYIKLSCLDDHNRLCEVTVGVSFLIQNCINSIRAMMISKRLCKKFYKHLKQITPMTFLNI